MGKWIAQGGARGGLNLDTLSPLPVMGHKCWIYERKPHNLLFRVCARFTFWPLACCCWGNAYNVYYTPYNI